MVTVDELTPRRPLPAPMVIEVTAVTWGAGRSRRAEVELVDTAGNPLRLVDYEGANLALTWEPGTRYRIRDCAVSEGGGGYDVELAPSKKTTIERLDTAETTELLVLGDTHVGRETHPGTGEQIDPLGAFIEAVEYGFDRDVDAVVHVGDVFHESATPLQAALVREEIFEPLAAAEIPFYYVRGNHAAQPGDGILADATGPSLSKLDTDGVAVDSDVRLFGLDHRPEGDLPWHRLGAPPARSDAVSVLVLHQTLEQLSGPGANHVDVERLFRAFNRSFDFVVSGHHHDAACGKSNGTPVMYTGAAERMSTNDDAVDRVAWSLHVRNGSISLDRYDIP